MSWDACQASEAAKRRKRDNDPQLALFGTFHPRDRPLSECKGAKRAQHVVDGATMLALVMTTLYKWSPSAQVFAELS